VSGRLGVEAGGFVDLEDGSPVALESASAGPVITFQIALASRPGDEPLVYTTVPGTLDISYQRGEPNEYGQMETGVSTVVVGDAASALDPGNPDSPYAPNVKRGKAMRAFITLDGTDYPLFQHFIERLPRTRSEASVWTERTVTGVDAFGSFALAGLKGKSYPGQASGARWGAVLDDIAWPAGRRNIDAGSSSLDAAAFADNDSTKALSHLLDVVSSENGFGFMDAEGDARFIERHAIITDTSVVATFADGLALATGDYPGALPYVELIPESTDVFNDYTGKRSVDGATVYTASDAASIEDYGLRSKELTLLVDSDLELQDALNWKLSQTREPDERVDAITVRPGTDIARWVAVLGLEVGDRVMVVEQPPGFAAPVERQFLIRHLSVSLPTDLAASEFTFQMTPASTDSWLVLDDPARDALDAGNKLTY
jgi:hypothetical protein